MNDDEAKLKLKKKLCRKHKVTKELDKKKKT